MTERFYCNITSKLSSSSHSSCHLLPSSKKINKFLIVQGVSNFYSYEAVYIGETSSSMKIDLVKILRSYIVTKPAVAVPSSETSHYIHTSVVAHSRYYVVREIGESIVITEHLHKHQLWSRLFLTVYVEYPPNCSHDRSE